VEEGEEEGEELVWIEQKDKNESFYFLI